jgi:hypothetical protein
MEFADGKILQFEVRGMYTNAEAGMAQGSTTNLPQETVKALGDKIRGITIGNLFYGSKGWMYVDGSTWRTFFGRKNEPGQGMESKEGAADPMNLLGTGDTPHFKNFIDAMRSRKVGPDRRRRGRPPLDGILPSRQYCPPNEAAAPVRRQYRNVR